jgi:hypothetical protein
MKRDSIWNPKFLRLAAFQTQKYIDLYNGIELKILRSFVAEPK